MTRNRLIIIGCAVFFIGLVVTFPARVAYQWFGANPVQVSGISGTVWNGNADVVNANGFTLTDLAWRMKPLQLFLGSAAFSIDSNVTGGTVTGDISIGIGGDVTASNIEAFVPLSNLQNALRTPGLQGAASAKFSELRLENNQLVGAVGTLNIANLISPLVSRAPIGGYRMEFQETDNGIIASVEDTGGVLDVAGNLNLQPDGAYAFFALVTAKAEASAQLRNNIQLLPTNDRGQHEVRIEGRL
ncbi:MAG: type II secretion system protein N [Pseudomonadota bacterium]